MIHREFNKLIFNFKSWRHIPRHSLRFFSNNLQVDVKESDLRKFINRRRIFDAYISFADDAHKIARSSKIAFWGLNTLFAVPSALMILTPPVDVHQSLSCHQFKMSAVSLVWSAAGIMAFHNGRFATFANGRLLTKSRPVVTLALSMASFASLIIADYNLTRGYILQVLLQSLTTLYNFILSTEKLVPPIVAKLNITMATLHVCGLAIGYCIATKSKYNNESNEGIIKHFESKH